LLYSAILSDVTTPANRSKALAQVGIAFAICFCIGPPIGAAFASPILSHSIYSREQLNIYAVPAILTLVLLVIETCILMLFLPETRNRSGTVHFSSINNSTYNAEGTKTGNDNFNTPAVKRSVDTRIQLLSTLRRLHFGFLGVFSGVEFTLTFLTFDCKTAGLLILLR
jgi:MFS family permease